MSHKYEAWFCSCGRIHFHPMDDLDWMSEDCENRRVLEVCRNCGHIHEQFLTESIYGDGDKPAFDVNGDDYFNDENVLIMENPNYRIYIRKGIKVPMKKGGYADYHFSNGYCNSEKIKETFGDTYIPTIKEKDPDYLTVDTDRLIKEIQQDYPEEADDLLKSISGYIVGISWKGTPYEHKWD